MPLTPFQIPAGRRLEFWDTANANAGVCWVKNESYSLKMTASPSSVQQTMLSIGPAPVLLNKIIDYYDLVRYSNDSTITVVNMEPDYNISLNDSITFKSKATVASSYTLTRAFGLSVSDITGSGSVTRQIGVHIASLTKGSTANIDLLIGTATPTVTSDYSIYNENTDDSYFAGDIGIGVDAPLSRLHVHGISGYAKKQLTISDTSGGTRKPGLNLRVDSTNLWQLYADNTSSNSFKLEYNEATTYLAMTTSGYLLLGGLTSSVEGQVQIQQNSIGTTQSDAYGINLINATAAAAGAQQYSPPLHWTGYGWKTDATAASQSVEFRAYVQPVQGTSAPTGLWVLESSINAGAYSSCLSFSSTALTASRLLQTDGAKTIISVSNLANWVLGTSNQITSTDVGNGTVQLSIPSTPTFTGLTLSGLTQGSVLFAGASGTITEDNSNLFWDNTNNELGIGTNAPSGSLHVEGTYIYHGNGASDQWRWHNWGSSNKILSLAIGGTNKYYFYEFTMLLNTGINLQMSALSNTTSTDGFFCFSTVSGTPTGVPTNGAGCACFEDGSNKLWIYNGSAWKSVTLA